MDIDPEKIAIPKKEKKMITETLKKVFPNLTKDTDTLLHLMFETIYKCGVNEGMQQSLQVIKKHGH